MDKNKHKTNWHIITSYGKSSDWVLTAGIGKKYSSHEILDCFFSHGRNSPTGLIKYINENEILFTGVKISMINDEEVRLKIVDKEKITPEFWNMLNYLLVNRILEESIQSWLEDERK